MTLLTICQQVARETSVTVPGSIIGNSEDTARKLLAFAQRAGKVLGNKDLAVLRKEHTFTTVASTAEYALPSDFDRFIEGAFWDRTSNWRVWGSQTPRDWQVLKSGPIATSANRKRYTVKRSASDNTKAVFIDPTPTSADSMAFEYHSNQWCQDISNTGQTAWAADSDTGIIEEYLIEMGMMWRVLRSLGHSYEIELREYEIELEKHLATDVGTEALDLAGWNADETVYTNIAEGDFTL